MNTALGTPSFTNFSTPKTFEYTSGAEPIDSPVPSNYISEKQIEEIILKKIASLKKGTEEINLIKDPNPLDNIIRDEVIYLLGFRKVSHTDIKRALDLYEKGQDASHDMSFDQHIILVSQARELEFITETEYLSLVTQPNMFWYLYPEPYLKTLQFQLNLPSLIPTIEELKIAGTEKLILDTVKNNQEGLIDPNIINMFTGKHINEILLKSEFIGYDKAQLIYKDPIYLLNILDKQTLESFLIRVQPYLNFITPEKINDVLKLLPSQFNLITNYFTPTQIRLMIDKELDIKNLILKTLTLEEVNKTFNSLAEEFKVDFTKSFTNEKLIELIQLTIKQLYPIPTNEEIYQNLAILYNTEISTQKIEQIENYLNNY